MVLLLAVGASCARQERQVEAEVAEVRAETLRTELKVLQEKEIAAENRKSTTREAFETLQEQYKAASEQDKPQILPRLLDAKADYLDAQREHMNAKRELADVERAYIRRLLQNPRGAKDIALTDAATPQ